MFNRKKQKFAHIPYEDFLEFVALRQNFYTLKMENTKLKEENTRLLQKEADRKNWREEAELFRIKESIKRLEGIISCLTERKS